MRKSCTKRHDLMKALLVFLVWYITGSNRVFDCLVLIQSAQVLIEFDRCADKMQNNKYSYLLPKPPIIGLLYLNNIC